MYNELNNNVFLFFILSINNTFVTINGANCAECWCLYAIVRSSRHS